MKWFKPPDSAFQQRASELEAVNTFTEAGGWWADLSFDSVKSLIRRGTANYETLADICRMSLRNWITYNVLTSQSALERGKIIENPERLSWGGWKN